MESTTTVNVDASGDNNIQQASSALLRAMESGCGLLILTGAGMSVASGVPTFRSADGTMSDEFLKFLGDYNQARAQHGLQEAPDWFNFSVPEMFRKETSKEAWAYWRWRILRARVEPGADYEQLDRIMKTFGKENCFVITSNCDCLHRDFVDDDTSLKEIHGSLAKLQCSGACTDELWNADEKFIQRLQDEAEWVPMCPKCETECLRPNVMIFGDDTLVYSALSEQNNNKDAFLWKFKEQLIVLEIGAGVVVPSIRYMAEHHGSKSAGGLIRINPSTSECEKVSANIVQNDKYWPVAEKSSVALKPIADALQDS